MTPEEPALPSAASEPRKTPAPAEKEPDPSPGLGVDWGSNIDPGPGPDPRAVEPGGRPPGRDMAV